MLPSDWAETQIKFNFCDKVESYDWLVAFDVPVKEEKLMCPAQNTILILFEPASYLIYPDNFLHQFGIIISPQEPRFSRHPCAIYESWLWDWKFYAGSSPIDYPTMRDAPLPVKKRDISLVCSDKTVTPFHQQRLAFIDSLKKHIPEIDSWGQGFNPIEKKADAIEPYRYHLTIENYQNKTYWSEKVTDAWLGYSLPFYYGATDLGKHFPPESFIPIDITRTEESVAIIRDAIANNEYERRLPHIMEARRLLMTKHNRFIKIQETINRVKSGEIIPHHPKTKNNTILTYNKCPRRSGTLNRFRWILKKKQHDQFMRQKLKRMNP